MRLMQANVPLSSDTFERLPLFQGLSAEQMNMLRSLFVPFDCYAGTVLFEQGELADHLYMLISGEAVIRYKPEDGEALTIAHIRSGGVVGWSAAIGRRKYTSGALCTEYTRTLRIRAADLQVLRQRYPEVSSMILERLARIVAQRSSTHPQVVALLNNGLHD